MIARFTIAQALQQADPAIWEAAQGYAKLADRAQAALDALIVRETTQK